MATIHRGWTLIEIIISIIIIGILVSIALPAYRSSMERSRCTNAMANLRTIRKAELSYFAENQAYTASLAELGDYVGAALESLDNEQWLYSFDGVPSAEGFIVQAQRLRGPFVGKVIKLDQDGSWAQSDYPINGPL